MNDHFAASTRADGRSLPKNERRLYTGHTIYCVEKNPPNMMQVMSYSYNQPLNAADININR
jgi:hypothetical protein